MYEVRLPGGYVKVAEVIGFGEHSHLSVVLAYNPNTKEFATWKANKSADPMLGSNCALGCYFKSTDNLAARAFDNFFERSRGFVAEVPDAPELSPRSTLA